MKRVIGLQVQNIRLDANILLFMLKNPKFSHYLHNSNSSSIRLNQLVKAYDACGTNLIDSSVPVPLNCDSVKRKDKLTVNITVSDPSGNSATCNVTLTAIDNSPDTDGDGMRVIYWNGRRTRIV